MPPQLQVIRYSPFALTMATRAASSAANSPCMVSFGVNPGD